MPSATGLFDLLIDWVPDESARTQIRNASTVAADIAHLGGNEGRGPTRRIAHLPFID